MGSLVLVRASGDPAAINAVGAALSHAEPGVRVVAARLVAVGGLVALRPALLAAFESETNEAVAAEQVRAIVMLGVSSALEPVDAYLSRTPVPPAVVVYGLELARHAPDQFVARLPQLVRALGPERAISLSSAVRLLTRQHPSRSGAVWRAWLQSSPGRGWSAALSDYEVPGEEILLEALASTSAVVREATVWHIVRWVRRELTVSPAVLDAALNGPADGSDWEMFGRELLARHVRSVTPEDWSSLVAVQSSSKREDLQGIDGSDLLTPEEQGAIDSVIGERQPGPGPIVPELPPLLRTPEVLWPGFFESLIKETRCRPGAWNVGLVRVTYVADGRPSALAIDPVDLSESCTQFAMALGQVALIDPATPVPSGGVQWLLVPSAREFISCVDAARPERGLPAPPPDPETESEIGDPKKSRHVAPTYPRDALRRRVVGAVVLEAQISREGCIQSAHTLRHVDLHLAVAAMRAVLQWHYRPAQQEGRPVDVLMTATVNFVL